MTSLPLPAATAFANFAGWLDPAVVALYLIATFWLGLRGSKLLHSERESEEDYYLAGRSVPGWINGVSYAVTLINADVALVYCGVAAGVGLPVAWFYISRFGLSLMLAAVLFAARWHQLGIRTGPEFYSLRFGGRASRWVRTYTSAYSVAIGTIPWVGAGLLAVHVILAPLLHVESKAVTLLIVLPVMLGYVWIAGFAGVLVTDVMQTAVIFAANIGVLIAVYAKFGGPSGLAAAVEHALPDKAHEILSLTPAAGHPVMGPLAVVAWLLTSTIGVGGNVASDGQRLFSCRSPQAAASVGVWCQVALFALLALLTLPTLGVLVHHPELYAAAPERREAAYGLLLHEFLPPGVLGLALAALLAAVMSTVAGLINYGSQTLLSDVCRPCFPDLSDRQSVFVGRLLTVLVLALSVVVMFYSTSLVKIAIVVTGLFGSTLTFGWGQWWWWRTNFWSWCAATIGGPIVYLTLQRFLPQWAWWREQAAVSPSAAQTMDMLHGALTMGTTTLLWIVVARLTPPESLETLKNFYRHARPAGLWGPVRQALGAESPEFLIRPHRGEILAGIALSLLGATWITLATLALSAAAVGRYATALKLAIVAGALALLFRGLFPRHVDRMVE